ncbi:MAG: tryptophan--tRNA ligase [Leptospirales bacterium]
MSKKTVLSGMQPTGKLHLGHYLGVLNNYTKLQNEYECFFMVANWHSLTVFYTEYEKAHNFIAPLVSDWIAAGIDPEKSTIFVQSDVKAHAELSLLLSMYTPVSWLTRNPSYKEKQENIEKDIDSQGFLGYPVLQAADIFLYNGQIVPIGEDQLPHLELSREIARRFNHITKASEGNSIIEPKALLSEYPKVLGTDGRKMSKSYGNTIALSEEIDSLTQKMRKMVTDTNRVRKTDKGDPEKCPVFTYYDYFLPARKGEIEKECRSAGIGCTDCKKIITDEIIKETEPFREKKEYFTQNPELLKEILHHGAEVASGVANETLERLKSVLGMSSNYLIQK